MAGKEMARRRGDCKRAATRPGWDANIVAREYEKWTTIAAIALGISFGIVFALGIIAG